MEPNQPPIVGNQFNGEPQQPITPSPIQPATQGPLPQAYAPAAPSPSAPVDESDKSYVATWLFAWLLGWLGIDRFYLGRIGTGVLKLITLGGLGIWSIIDLIRVLAGTVKDKSGRPLRGRAQYLKISLIITIVIFAIGIIGDSIFFATGGYSHIFKNASLNASNTTQINQYTQSVNDITSDVNNISTDINGSASTQTVQTDCQSLSSDVDQAKTMQILNNSIGHDFSQVVNDAGKVATDCSSIASSNFSQSSEIQFNTDLNSLTQAVKSLGKAE